jgi:hypothetical protein
MGNPGLILSGKNMTPQFLICPMLLNILTVLANLPGLIIQFSQKTSVTSVATLTLIIAIVGMLVVVVVPPLAAVVALPVDETPYCLCA